MKKVLCVIISAIMVFGIFGDIAGGVENVAAGIISGKAVADVRRKKITVDVVFGERQMVEFICAGYAGHTVAPVVIGAGGDCLILLIGENAHLVAQNILIPVRGYKFGLFIPLNARDGVIAVGKKIIAERVVFLDHFR